MSQPQDSPATPDQESGEASGQSAASFGGADQSPSGYGPAGQATPGHGAANPGQSGYGTPGQGHGTPGQGQSGYGTPGSQAYPGYPPPGYGTPGGQPYPGYPQPGYGTPGQSPSGYGAASPGQPGYSAPGQSPPGYGTPGSQAYPSYPQPGYGTSGQAPPGYGTPGSQAYPSYPQPGYGQPYQSGYGQYQGYGQPNRAFEPVMGRRNPALAEWWRRLLARLIDGLILGVIFSPFWISPWSNFFRTVQNINSQYPNGGSAASKALATADVHFFGKIIVVLLFFYVVAFLYDWIQHWQWGQTIGKRALGTRVVRDDGNPNLGAGPAGGRAAIYAFAPLIPVIGSLFELLNELWLTWDPRRQCLHDKAAHTVVVKKDFQGPQLQPGGWQQGSW